MRGDKKVWVHFLAFFFFAHSPPTAMFQDETVTDLMSFWDYLFKFLPLITSHILSIYSHIFWVLFKLCTAFRMVLVSSMSIHIVQHPTSRDWGNLYHPTQLSDCSFPLSVALWFSSYVSMSAAFLKKKEVHCWCSFKPFHVRTWRTKGSPSNNYLENCFALLSFWPCWQE